MAGPIINVSVLADTSQFSHAMHSLNNTNLDRLSRKFRKLSKDVGSSLGRIAAKAAKGAVFTSLAMAAASAVGPILSVATALGTATVQLAGFATLAPAALGGVAAAFGALKVGLTGFSDAMKAIGDPKKFAEALQGMAPAARAAAVAVRDVKGGWDDLTQSVQQKLFAGMAGEIRNLAKQALPPLKSGLSGVASGWNAIFKAAGPALAQLAKSRGVSQIFASVQASLTNMAGAVQPALHALSVLFAFGSGQGGGGLAGNLNSAATAAGKLGTWVTKIAQRFDDFITKASKTGQLQEWLDGAKDAASGLWSILKSVGSIVGGVFSAMGDSKVGLAGMAETLKTVAKVINGPAFQKGLGSFFDGVSAGLSAVRGALPAVGSAIAALGPLIGQIVKAIGPLAGTVLKTLAKAVERLVPAFEPFISGIAKGLGPLLDSLSKAFLSIVDALAPIFPVLGKLAAVLGKQLAKAVTALMPAITALLTALTPIIPIFAKLITSLSPIIPMIAKLAATLIAGLVPILAPLITLLGKVAGIVAKTLMAALVALMPAFQAIIKAVLSLLPALLPLVKAIVSVGLALLPLVPLLAKLVASIVKALLPILVPLIKVLAKVATVIVTLVATAVKWLVTFIINKIVPAAKQMVRYFMEHVWPKMRDAFQWIGDKAKWLYHKVIQPTFQLLRQAAGKVRDKFWDVVHGIRDAYTFVKNKTLSAVKWVVDKFLWFAEKIVGAADKAFGWIPGLGGKLDKAKKAIHNFRVKANKEIDNLKDGHVKVDLSTPGLEKITNATLKLRGGKQIHAGGFASGGVVGGQRKPYGDKVAAMLAPGEFVVSNRHGQADRYRDLLHAINTGRMRGYASGGPVMSGLSTGVSRIGKAVSSVNLVTGSLVGAVQKIADQMVDHLSSIGKGMVSVARGGNTSRWTGTAIAAMKAAGLPLKYLGLLMYRMNVESGGNPRAINLWDSNAAIGQASRGLMQTIPSTFAAYAGPYRSLGIFNPFANIYAAIMYTLARYGLRGIRGAWGGVGGYATGTANAGGGWKWVGENGPELMRVPAGSQILDHEKSTEATAYGGPRIDTVILNAPSDKGKDFVGELSYELHRLALPGAYGSVR